MDIGLCTIANKGASVEDVLAVAADAGYDAIEVWGKGHVGDRAPDTCETIRSTADDRGLDIAVYGSYLRPGTEEYDREVDRELEAASALGASRIRAWAGREEYRERTPDHWTRVVADLRDLSDRAAEEGLAVTVEKHGGTLTNAGEGARRLVEAVDRDNCGLNWQPLFSLSADELLAEARALAPLSNNVHIQAVPHRGGTWRERCLLEDAHFDVPEVVAAFDGAGFDGCIEVEFVTDDLPFEAAVRRDREYLASLVSRSSR